MVFAHNNHVVLGNLRPTIVLFDWNGAVKVTDFSLQDYTSDVETAFFYYLEGEERSQSSDIYTVGVLLYQLFTGCFPRRRNEIRFVIRKALAKLPIDIQSLISKMLSIIPAYRSQNSLQHAIELFDSQLFKRQQLSFTERPVRVKNLVDDRRQKDQSNPARLGKVNETSTVTGAEKQMPHSQEDSRAIPPVGRQKQTTNKWKSGKFTVRPDLPCVCTISVSI